MAGLKNKIQETLRTMSTGAQSGASYGSAETSHLNHQLTSRGKSGPRRRKRWRSKHPLRELRLERGYTLEELAELTDLSPSYLSRLESGSRRLNSDIMQKLSGPLMCHPGDLLTSESSGTRTHYASMPAEGVGQMGASPQLHAHAHVQPQTADLPLYHLATTSLGEHTIDFAHPTQWIARPSELSEVSRAYAISMPTNIMAPRYMAGERLLAHPTKSLSQKCFVIVTTKEGGLVVGQFLGWQSSQSAGPSLGPIEANDNDKLVLGQISDEMPVLSGAEIDGRQILLTRAQIASIARVVGNLEAS